MASDDTDAETALDALVAEAVLVRAADKAGLPPDPAGLRKADRLMVRAFLHDMEADHEPRDIPPEKVRADFEKYRDNYQVLERRASTHLLAKSDGGAARATVLAALEEARSADDPIAALRRFAEARAQRADFEVLVEELPPITRKASMEKPFIDALFGARAKGLLKDPIKTSYGWHAIVLTDIQPAQARTLGDVEEDIRGRLSDQSRFETLVALVQALEAEGLVVYNPAVVTRLLEAPGLPRREP